MHSESLEQYVYLNAASGFYYLLRPLIESALLKMWLKVERSYLDPWKLILIY